MSEDKIGGFAAYTDLYNENKTAIVGTGIASALIYAVACAFFKVFMEKFAYR